MKNTTKENARTFLVLLSIALTIAGFWLLIIEIWNFLLLSKTPIDNFMKQTILVSLCILQYLIGITIPISFCAWGKKGFNNLKSIKKSGIKRWTLIIIPAFAIPLGLLLGILLSSFSSLSNPFIRVFAVVSTDAFIIATVLGLYDEYSKQYPDKPDKKTIKNILLKYKGEKP